MKYIDRYKLGKKIKEKRLDEAITQAEMAKFLEVAPATVSNWENGARSPSNEMLWNIAQCLGVQMDYFFDYDDIDKTTEERELEEKQLEASPNITLQTFVETRNTNIDVNDLVKMVSMSARLTRKQFDAIMATMESMLDEDEE